MEKKTKDFEAIIIKARRRPYDETVEIENSSDRELE